VGAEEEVSTARPVPTAIDWLRVNAAIGTLSFGSASRIVLYEDAVVREHGWLDPEEFAEVLTVAQLLPGPNLVNLSAYLGYRLVGPVAAVLGVLCLCLPGALLAVALSGVLAVEKPWVQARSGDGSGESCSCCFSSGGDCRGWRHGGSRTPAGVRVRRAWGPHGQRWGGDPPGTSLFTVLGWQSRPRWCSSSPCEAVRAVLDLLPAGAGLLGSVFAVLPELQRALVDEGLITPEGFVQAFALGQLVPGPNMAMCPVIGWHVAGLAGAVVAFFGIYSGPVAIMGAAYAVYHRWRDVTWVRRLELSVRPVVLGLLAASAVSLLRTAAGTQHRMALGVAVVVGVLAVKTRLGALALLFLGGLAWARCQALV
jgi:chromate transporter